MYVLNLQFQIRCTWITVCPDLTQHFLNKHITICGFVQKGNRKGLQVNGICFLILK